MTVLVRGHFTTYLITQLSTALSLPVGDNNAPTEAHGWQGEPNDSGSNFIPWVVVAPSQASKVVGSLGDSQSDWRVPYYLTSCGVTRAQTESLADLVRNTTKAMLKQPVSLGAATWKLTNVDTTTIGGVSRIGSTNPSYHVQSDVTEFWLSKEI